MDDSNANKNIVSSSPVIPSEHPSAGGEESLESLLASRRTSELSELELQSHKDYYLRRFRDGEVIGDDEASLNEELNNYISKLRNYRKYIWVADDDVVYLLNRDRMSKIPLSNFCKYYKPECMPDLELKHYKESFYSGEEICGHITQRATRAEFHPGAGPIVNGDILNLWSPPVDDVACGEDDLSILTDHIREHFPDDLHFGYFMDILYYTLIMPEKKLKFGVLLLGPQGVGKSTIIHTLLRTCMGRRIVKLGNPEEIKKGFKGCFKNAKATILNELRSEGSDGNLYELLKTHMSDEDHNIETKGKDSDDYINYGNNFLMSNWDYPTRLDGDDRKILVMRSARQAIPFDDPRRAAEDAKFGLLHKFIRNDAGKIMYWFRNHYKLSGTIDIDSGTAPMTAEKEDMIDMSRRPVERCVAAFLEGLGNFPRIFQLDDFNEFAKHPDWEGERLGNPGNRSEALSKAGCYRFGRQRNMRRGLTTKRLFGTPGKDWSGVSSTDAAALYRDDYSKLRGKRKDVEDESSYKGKSPRQISDDIASRGDISSEVADINDYKDRKKNDGG